MTEKINKLLRIFLIMLTVLPAEAACDRKEAEEEELDGRSLLYSITGQWICVSYKIDDVEQGHDGMYLNIPYPGGYYESNLPFLDSRNNASIDASSIYFFVSSGNKHFFVSTSGVSDSKNRKPSAMILYELKDSGPRIECSFAYKP